MRFAQLLLLLIVSCIACCNSFTAAESVDQVQQLTTDTDVTEDAHRYLKGSSKKSDADAVDEERAVSFKQYLGALKLPKFSKLPGVKQLNQIRRKYGKKIGDAYVARMKKQYEANPQNFI
jgi:hypothetical protein